MQTRHNTTLNGSNNKATKFGFLFIENIFIQKENLHRKKKLSQNYFHNIVAATQPLIS